MANVPYENELKIASGWNNTAGYSLITDLTDSDGIPFHIPSPFEMHQMVTRKPTLARAVFDTVNEFYAWKFTGLTIKQLRKLYDDYQVTNDSKVTVRTVGNDGTLGDFNANIVVPPQWQEMLQSPTGVAVRTPGNHRSNYLTVTIGFNVKGTAS